MRSASFSTRKLESSLGIDAMPAKALGAEQSREACRAARPEEYFGFKGNTRKIVGTIYT
jgi:hypothetical protein